MAASNHFRTLRVYRPEHQTQAISGISSDSAFDNGTRQMKRKILLIAGIIVAIFVLLYTSTFGTILS